MKVTIYAAIAVALLSTSAFARSQVVGSPESAMKESQFQGPNSREYGPDRAGRYFVTNRRHFHHRHHFHRYR